MKPFREGGLVELVRPAVGDDRQRAAAPVRRFGEVPVDVVQVVELGDGDVSQDDRLAGPELGKELRGGAVEAAAVGADGRAPGRRSGGGRLGN